MPDGTGQPTTDSSAASAQTKTRRPWRLPVEREAEKPDGAVVRRLILGSALMLFLELALIRWLGANVVHLSYFSNFVLLGSFLGIGLGFLISRRGWSVLPAAPGHPVVSGHRHLPGSGDHRPGRRRGHLLHLAEHHRPARLVGVAIDLRAGRGLPGRARRGGRPVLRAPAPADRLPLGPGRLAAGNRPVHPDVVPAGAVRGLGHPRHDRLRGADRQVAAVPGRSRGPRDDRCTAGRDALPRYFLVAVLQDPHRRPDRRRHLVDRHLGERRAAPDHAGRPAATAGGAAIRVPVRAHRRATR